MKRIAGISAALLAALLLAAAALLGWMLTTEAGLRELAAAAQRFSGGRLTLGTVRGRLLREFSIEGLHYRGSDGLRIDLASAQVRLRTRDLLARSLHFERVRLDGLKLTLPSTTPTPGTNTATALPQGLPLDLRLDDFSLQDFAVFDSGGAQYFALERLTAALIWIGEDLQLARLETKLPELGALRADGQAQLGADRISVSRLRIQGPGRVELFGTLGLGTTPSVLAVQWQDLHWPVEGSAPARLSGSDGRAQLQGRFDDYRYTIEGKARLQGVEVKFAARGRGDSGAVAFDSLQLTADSGRVDGRGRLGWAPRFGAELDAQFARLDPALWARDWNGALNGRLSVHSMSGEAPTHWAFKLALERSQLRGQTLSGSAAGQTDGRSARFDELALQAAGGRVEGKGDIAWSPQPRADLNLTLSALDPGVFAPGWPGSLNGRVTTRTIERGARNAIGFDLRLERSTLRDRPLRLSAQGEYDFAQLALQNLELQLGDTRLLASGQALPPFDLRGRFDSPDLAALDPELGGRADLRFEFSGTRDDPHLIADGQAQNLRYGAYRASRVSLRADLDPQADSHLKLEVLAAQAGLAIRRLDLDLAGREIYHHLQIAADTERGSAALAFDGGYDRQRHEWGGSLSRGELAPAGLPPWTLEKPAGLLLGGRRQSLEPACFSGDGGRACLRLEQNVTGLGLRLSWDLERLLLAAFQPLLPKRDRLEGTVDGAGSLEFVGGDLTAITARLQVEQASLQFGQAPALKILPSTASAEEREGTVHAQVDLRTAQGTLSVQASAAPGASLAARPLSGHAHLEVPDLAFVQAWLPELQTPGGKLSGDFDVAGAVAQPRLAGALTLEDGHARLARAGISLEDARLQLSGDGSGPLALSGSVRSGEGRLQIEGQVDPSIAPPGVSLRLYGENFLAMATPEAHLSVTPDLTLKTANDGWHLDGSLSVPKAEIRPQGFGDRGVAVSEDQVIVGAPPAPSSTPLELFTNLRIALGDAVRVEGYGLTTRVEGSVTIAEAPQQPATAQGELRLVDGHYQAYGQDLTIESGRLIFSGGPVTQPAVDLYATRHPSNDITVGVRVRGPLDRPQLTLQSDPAMPREQQLAWLVLGHPLDQSSGGDRSAVAQAALALGLSGGDYLAQKLGKGIGLDVIALGQAPAGGSPVAADAAAIQGSQAARTAGSTGYTTQAAQLTLGKYLTPRLFVSYGVSLFQPGQTFRLSYDLGHGFKVQTESGTASGGDVIYTFERGK
ncbi:MAG: translocation/assembly module TamB domain-containing protein [Sinobacteraceae bacterium]|nr:translocation/assembly module TamB domain-containing protein [Nevskiaceae bacterium]